MSFFPIGPREIREHWISERDECPECGGELDTGYECNKCQFDALPELRTYSTEIDFGVLDKWTSSGPSPNEPEDKT